VKYILKDGRSVDAVDVNLHAKPGKLWSAYVSDINSPSPRQHHRLNINPSTSTSVSRCVYDEEATIEMASQNRINDGLTRLVSHFLGGKDDATIQQTQEIVRRLLETYVPKRTLDEDDDDDGVDYGWLMSQGQRRE
jgi:hypothetical protein